MNITIILENIHPMRQMCRLQQGRYVGFFIVSQAKVVSFSRSTESLDPDVPATCIESHAHTHKCTSARMQARTAYLERRLDSGRHALLVADSQVEHKHGAHGLAGGRCEPNPVHDCTWILSSGHSNL